jgi:CHAT domain-containing protein
VDYGSGSGPGSFGTLPETDAEVRALRARFGEDATLLVGAEATVGRVRSLAPSKRFLHLATHGFVRGEGLGALPGAELLPGGIGRHLAAGHDPMLRSGLALAGANSVSDADDDGLLTAAEVSDLDLSTCDLVVLSACDSARGTVAAGEGVLGLVRGFRLAGAGTVVGSLWPVRDEATRLLMERFYDALLREKDPLPPARALHEASRWLRAQPRFSAPRHWAAFVVYGRRPGE